MTAAVYRLYGEDFALLYVGSSKNPKLRLGQHRRASWWRRVICYRLTDYPTLDEARAAEREAIRLEQPEVNVLGKSLDPRHPLRVLRESKHLSQERLASAAGCSTKTISSYESGAFRPGFGRLSNLAVALDVTLGEALACFIEQREPVRT